ncbi:uncharacterized protein [Hyperolius riggenbachi]|uniref:uncharacterized protein n=1 Tax=Hyperolius riggenbachi TaxID=752182 RepID=UPI0035A30426
METVYQQANESKLNFKVPDGEPLLKVWKSLWEQCENANERLMAVKCFSKSGKNTANIMKMLTVFDSEVKKRSSKAEGQKSGEEVCDGCGYSKSKLRLLEESYKRRGGGMAQSAVPSTANEGQTILEYPHTGDASARRLPDTREFGFKPDPGLTANQTGKMRENMPSQPTDPLPTKGGRNNQPYNSYSNAGESNINTPERTKDYANKPHSATSGVQPGDMATFSLSPSTAAPIPTKGVPTNLDYRTNQNPEVGSITMVDGAKDYGNKLYGTTAGVQPGDMATFSLSPATAAPVSTKGGQINQVHHSYPYSENGGIKSVDGAVDYANKPYPTTAGLQPGEMATFSLSQPAAPVSTKGGPTNQVYRTYPYPEERGVKMLDRAMDYGNKPYPATAGVQPGDMATFSLSPPAASTSTKGGQSNHVYNSYPYSENGGIKSLHGAMNYGNIPYPATAGVQPGDMASFSLSPPAALLSTRGGQTNKVYHSYPYSENGGIKSLVGAMDYGNIPYPATVGVQPGDMASFSLSAPAAPLAMKGGQNNPLDPFYSYNNAVGNESSEAICTYHYKPYPAMPQRTSSWERGSQNKEETTRTLLSLLPNFTKYDPSRDPFANMSTFENECCQYSLGPRESCLMMKLWLPSHMSARLPAPVAGPAGGPQFWSNDNHWGSTSHRVHALTYLVTGDHNLGIETLENMRVTPQDDPYEFARKFEQAFRLVMGVEDPKPPPALLRALVNKFTFLDSVTHIAASKEKDVDSIARLVDRYQKDHGLRPASEWSHVARTSTRRPPLEDPTTDKKQPMERRKEPCSYQGSYCERTGNMEDQEETSNQKNPLDDHENPANSMTLPLHDARIEDS